MQQANDDAQIANNSALAKIVKIVKISQLIESIVKILNWIIQLWIRGCTKNNVKSCWLRKAFKKL